MAVVDVIDLTTPSPPRIVISNDGKGTAQSKGTRRDKAKNRDKDRSKNKMKNNKGTKEDQEYHARQKLYKEKGQQERRRHDELADEDRYRHGEKRKREDEEDDYQHARKWSYSPTPPVKLFTVDVIGGPVPIALPLDHVEPSAEPAVEPATESSSVENSLLLPAHVVLAAHDANSVQDDNPPLSPISEASGIEFLDDDRAIGAPRYFDERAANSKTLRLRGPCKNCGDHDHEVKACPNMICLTCGARNEHTPRSCPILRFCWNCKGKGHVAKDCPRLGNMDPQRLDRQDCERCGSWKHHGTNCPTIWRIYTYLTDAEREDVLAKRESKRRLGFDAGGEGYISRDRWCYNCGERGHFGDDCNRIAPNHDKPDDYSAFGSYNQLTGPFASLSVDIPEFENQRAPREWENGGQFDDGYGFSAEADVGRKGRENAKAKAREAQRLVDEADDEPDWFTTARAGTLGGRGNTARPLRPGQGGLPSKPPPSIVQSGFRNSGSSRRPWDAPAPNEGPSVSARPSLRDRIDLGDTRSSGSSRRDHGEKKRDQNESRKDSRDKRSGEKRRDSGEKRGREEKRNSHQDHDAWRGGERGSRWRGGYDR